MPIELFAGLWYNIQEVILVQEMTRKHTHELDQFYYKNRNTCTNCGHLFTEGETAHLGHLKDRSPAVLCDRCAILLDETVVRYYWMKDPFESPDPEDKLWRYMDIAKFISMLNTNSLYFASADSFEDPFEGAKGTLDRESKWNDYYLDFFRYAVKTAPGISTEKCSTEKIEKTSKRLLSELEQNGLSTRRSACISCWHCNDFESEAMWKLYSANVTNAVAIKTTYNKLYQALGEDPYIDIGKVKYIDYSKQFTAIGFGAYWYKRKSFEHEHEVRAILRNYKNDGTGISHPVNLDILIESVYVSPYAPEWFAEVVRSVVKKYGLNKPVLYSTMTEKPFY